MKVLCERKVGVLLVIDDAQDHNKKRAMREKGRKWDDGWELVNLFSFSWMGQ
jgi:hypothetical protein